MVFESLVVDLLNRFLGDYVVNLDPAQLKIGIWGGDVVLNNLVLKQSALSELDLPIQTVYGLLEKLVIKIPWKNIYTDSVVVSIEGLYFLVKPNNEVKYNAEKEEKKLFDDKQTQLRKADEARKKPVAKTDDTFVEKLVTQIIRNVQLSIKNIHVRYEESKIDVPFAMGVTLSDLTVQTTDENWTPTIVQDMIKKIYKIVTLEGLSVYWNCNTQMYSEMEPAELTIRLKNDIASKTNTLEHFKYILGPMNSSARLIMNQKPELDSVPYSSPKIHAELVIEKLNIGIARCQYQDIVNFADSMELQRQGMVYRKFRPNLKQYKGHYREWWKFAYKCIVEMEVNRRKTNWNWDHMIEHRDMCRLYGTEYKRKKTNTKVDKDLERSLKELEKKLNIFSLILIREQIHMELAKLEQLMESKPKGWFNWIWKSPSSDIFDKTNLLAKFQNAMSNDEKEKLYRAIDYNENSAPVDYPDTYEDLVIKFQLENFELNIRNDTMKIPSVICSNLETVMCSIKKRPVNKGLKINVKIENLNVYGVAQDGLIPNIISSKGEVVNTAPLLEVLFEMNPIDMGNGQRLHVNALPVKIIYDSKTIIESIEVFKLPSSSTLEQLSHLTAMKLNNLREMSAAGLQHVIDQHTRIDLDIRFAAPYVLIPFGGLYTGVENVLVANFGVLTLISENRKTSLNTIRKQHNYEVGKVELLSEMMEQSYDNFHLELGNVQILIAQSDENWSRYIFDVCEGSPMHLLTPSTFQVLIESCLIHDDPKLPLMKISAEVPSILVNITDTRLLLLLSLIKSLPANEQYRQLEPITMKSISSSSLFKYLEPTYEKPVLPVVVSTAYSKDELVQLTKLKIKILLKDITLKLSHQEMLSAPVSDIIRFNLDSIQCTITQQSFNTDVDVSLKSISMEQFINVGYMTIISTPIDEKHITNLFNINFKQVDKKSPEFITKYKSCEKTLLLTFSTLSIILNQEALQELMKFSNEFQSQLSENLKASVPQRDRMSAGFNKRKRHLSTNSLKALQLTKRKKKATGRIQFKLIADMHRVSVCFESMQTPISSISISGLHGQVIIKDETTNIECVLNNFKVLDLNKQNIHNRIVTIDPTEEALRVTVTLFNEEYERKNEDQVNISIGVTMGCIRISYVNWYLNNMLDFLNRFNVAQRAIAEASEKAAKSAKENMQNIYEKATRILLNIKLKAPEIIIPESSKAKNALRVDLGYITMGNQFLELNIKNEQGDCAVVDELWLKLDEMKIERITYDSSGLNVINMTTLLEPVSFTLSISRNLTCWYKAVPDIDIQGNIEVIQLMLSEADVGTIMQVLTVNLVEGKHSAPPPRSSQPDLALSVKPPVNTPVRYQSIIPADVEEETSLVHTTLRWNFIMNCFRINLFVTDSVVARSGLAELSLEGLSVRGRMLSNNSILNALLLVNCLLTDTRPGREEKINCLLSRVQDEPDTHKDSILNIPRNMLDVTFQQKHQDIYMDVRIYSFTFILSIEYMLKLSNFFLSSLTKKAVKVAETTATLGKDKGRSDGGSSLQVAKNIFSLTLKLEKPNLILVEEMESDSTRAMILNSEVLLKLRIIDTHQNINGVITDLQVYTCMFDPRIREQTRNSVLDPLTVSVAGSTPEDKGLHVEVHVTDIRISVTLQTMELINNILKSLMPNQHVMNDDALITEDYSDMWSMKEVLENEFWFLKSLDDATDVLNYNFNTPKKSNLKELCIFKIPMILVTLEAGVGNKTFPMLMMESSFEGRINDWSHQLLIEASMTLQMGYYNSHLALWEPLIEPVSSPENPTLAKPWELRVEVQMNDTSEESQQTPLEENGEMSPVQAGMSIDISSSTNLEVTVTKTCIEVLNNLGKLFASALSEDITSTGEEAPYKVINATGETITLLLDKSHFYLCTNRKAETIHLETGAEAYLDLKKQVSDTDRLVKMLNAVDQTIIERFLYVQIPDCTTDVGLPIQKADTRFFMVKSKNVQMGLVSSITVDNGVTIITVSSILEVHNNFNIPLDMYYMRDTGNELEFIASIKPHSSMHVPMKAVYSQTSELFFSVTDYSVTTTPFVWKELLLTITTTKNLICSSKKNNEDSFVIHAVGKMSQVYFNRTNKHTMASTIYDIYLGPVVVLKNCLPVDIIFCVQNLPKDNIIEAGRSLEIPNVEPGKTYIIIRIPDYLEKEWSCQRSIQANQNQFSVWLFESFDSVTKVSLDLGMHTINSNGSFTMTLYCPFWMLNKTGLPLAYRSGDENLNILTHPPLMNTPIMFSFNAKNFFGKKKACVRVGTDEWSDKFSIDVAGSSGVVVCKHEAKLMQIGVNNRLTYNGLTKEITFTPYYVIINNTSLMIEVQETDRPADRWTVVQGKACAALWPHSERDDKLIRLRIVDTEEISAPFLITESHTTLLKLKNKYGGINVDIQLAEGSVYINLAIYDVGMSPALIVNNTQHALNIWEKESVTIRKLPPNNKMYYTWENPSGQRVLIWEGGFKKELENDLRMDGTGQYHITEQDIVYWVSFLDGMQRILLFTTISKVAENAQASKEFEIIDREITVQIYGMGFSIVNNLKRQEVMYVGIASTGIIWETCKVNGKRYKQMNTKENIAMEKAYQSYLINVEIEDDLDEIVNVDDKLVADFENNILYKPNKRKLRRRFQVGLWFQMKTSKHQMQLHAKVNRLQIDNQLFDCTFPVVLAPVPPPKSIAAIDAHKPFAELSIVQLLIKNSQIQQFKYFKVLIQEFHVKVDLGFINALMDVLHSSESEKEAMEHFLADLEMTKQPLYSHVSTQSIAEQKNFYDVLHFSPLKIHVSFSMSAGSHGISNMPVFLNVLLQGIGVTLTDLQDVIFKLAYFQRDYTFLTKKQLVREATTHYLGQTVKQLYVLVLGLDVIGNPYGLVVGISQGVEDLFYEPFQGAIQGPGEFAEGLVLGMRSLFGHTVGGAAGAVSRITGAMGKGIAALTFDKEYQRKRRDQINKRPATVQEGIARGGKGLVMGVYDGVTGVFTKPISGAKEQGVGGFFKGLGKGAVGLVTRPTAGVMDFASTSFETVKRVTDFGHEEISRLRSPRFLQADGFVRPYNELLAAGNKLLCELEKGKYSTTDIYSCHFTIIENKEVLLMSDKRVAYIVHSDLFGGWQVDWSSTWQEMDKKPVQHTKGVQVFLETKKKGISLFSSADVGKLILISDADKCSRIVEKFTQHMWCKSAVQSMPSELMLEPTHSETYLPKRSIHATIIEEEEGREEEDGASPSSSTRKEQLTSKKNPARESPDLTRFNLQSDAHQSSMFQTQFSAIKFDSKKKDKRWFKKGGKSKGSLTRDD